MQTPGLLDSFPLWTLVPLTVPIAMLSVEVGYRSAKYLVRLTVVVLLLVLIGCVSLALGQDKASSEKSASGQTEKDIETGRQLAPVEIDGKVLFSVEGAPHFQPKIAHLQSRTALRPWPPTRQLLLQTFDQFRLNMELASSRRIRG